MVNNAGISPIGIQGPGQRTHETSEISWDKIMGVNGKGVWLGCSKCHWTANSNKPAKNKTETEVREAIYIFMCVRVRQRELF